MNNYTLLNNREASKYDLYLPGRLVAALHYKFEAAEHEMMLIYCEAIERVEADKHCQELMRQAIEHVKNRRLKLSITCPIALKALREASIVDSGSSLEPAEW